MKIDMVFIIVVIIIALLTIRGAHRGLVGLILGTLGWVFTLGFVAWMSPHMEDYLLESSYKEWVYTQVEEHVRKTVDEQVDDKSDDLEYIVDGFEIPLISELIVEAQSETEQQLEGTKTLIVMSVSESITNHVVQASAMVVCIIIAMIISLVLSLVKNAIHDIPVVGGASRLIGGLWGLFEGLMVVWTLFILVTSLTVSELGQTVMVSIANNPILLYLYQNNLILKVVDQIRNAIGG